MPSNPVEAGRKGGKSRSPAKLAAARRNGFQRVYPLAVPPALEAPAKEQSENAAPDPKP